MNTSKTSLQHAQEKTFAVIVKTALLQRGLKMKDLADLIDRPRTSVSKAVNQERFPEIRVAIRCALELTQ